MFVGQCCIRFGEMAVQVLCPFFNGWHVILLSLNSSTMGNTTFLLFHYLPKQLKEGTIENVFTSDGRQAILIWIKMHWGEPYCTIGYCLAKRSLFAHKVMSAFEKCSVLYINTLLRRAHITHSRDRKMSRDFGVEGTVNILSNLFMSQVRKSSPTEMMWFPYSKLWGKMGWRLRSPNSWPRAFLITHTAIIFHH